MLLISFLLFLLIHRANHIQNLYDALHFVFIYTVLIYYSICYYFILFILYLLIRRSSHTEIVYDRYTVCRAIIANFWHVIKEDRRCIVSLSHILHVFVFAFLMVFI